MRTSHIIAAICLAMGCSRPQWAEPPAARAEEPPVNDAQFHARLLEIAGEYPGYGRVNKNLANDAAGCRDFADRSYYNDRYAEPPEAIVPPPALPSFSDSEDEASHGRKVYYLFVAMVDDYVFPSAYSSPSTAASLDVARARLRAPVGQAIVKESWVPKPYLKTAANSQEVVITRHQQAADGTKTEVHSREFPYAEREGKAYHAAERSSLFIMFKLDPATPDTDNGWVYGTVTADNMAVTSAGKVSTCMGCHQHAPNDRQFGLKAF